MPCTQNSSFLLALLLCFIPTLGTADDGGESKSFGTYLAPDVSPSMKAVEGEQGTIAVGGMMQLYAIPMLGEDALRDSGDAADAEGFRLRRARLALSGTFPKYVTMNLTLNPLDADHMVHDAHLAYRPLEEIGLVIGAAKVPYSRMQLDSSSTLRFVDRPLSTGDVAMDHRLGIAVEGSFMNGVIGYVAGIYNASGSYGGGDVSDGMLYGGRLESLPLGALAKMTPTDFRLRLGGGAMIADEATVDTVAWSTDLHLEYMWVRLRGEFLSDVRTPDSDPVLAPTIASEIERQSIVGEFTSFVLVDRVELAFRYEQYDNNHELEDWGDVDIYVGGLNGYIYEHRLKIQLNYIHRDEKAGTELDNDALILSFGGSI